VLLLTAVYDVLAQQTVDRLIVYQSGEILSVCGYGMYSIITLLSGVESFVYLYLYSSICAVLFFSCCLMLL
jgi:hypothetical protein